MDLDPFPNLKLAVISLLDGLVDSDTTTPPDLARRMPFARVTGRGGSDDHLTGRRLFDIDVFASTEHSCDSLAELVAQRLTSSPRVVRIGSDVIVIDGADTVTAPQIVPWSTDRDLWRSVATYSFKTRRTGAT